MTKLTPTQENVLRELDNPNMYIELDGWRQTIDIVKRTYKEIGTLEHGTFTILKERGLLEHLGNATWELSQKGKDYINELDKKGGNK